MVEIPPDAQAAAKRLVKATLTAGSDSERTPRAASQRLSGEEVRDRIITP